MHRQNLQEEVIKITKPLSLEDANDIFYKIILQKKLEQAEEDVKKGKIYTIDEAKDKLKRWFS